jgi:hypothetical protein
VAFYLAALALFAHESIAMLRKVAIAPLRAPSLNPWLTAGALVTILALKLSCIYYAAHHFVAEQPWERDLPLRVAHDNGPVMSHPDLLAFFDLLLAIASCLMLWCLAAGLDEKPAAVVRRIVVVAGAAMALLSVASPVLTSPDAYLNIGYALLGPNAYHPPSSAFPGSFALVNRFWGVPMMRALYGPLWIGAVTIVTHAAPTLLGKLLALRLLACAAFAGTIWALFAMRLPLSIVALVALTPDWWLQLVLNAHGDVLALYFIGLSGAALMAGLPVFAVIGTVAAGFVKVNYAIAATSIYALLELRRERVMYAGLSLLCAGVLLLLVGNLGLTRAVSVNVQLWLSNLLVPAHVVAAVFAVVLVILALVRRQRFESGPWLFAAWGPTLLPWYLAIGVPYALALRERARTFFILVPMGMLFLDTVFYRWWIGALLFTSSIVWAAGALLVKSRESATALSGAP